MSRIIDKLVAASGGWEKFLYQTLREVCDELAPAGYDAGVGGIVDEARDVLKAYEETKGQPNVVVSTPVVKIQAQAAVEVDESAKPAQSDKFESHKSTKSKSAVESAPVPREFKVKVHVDKDAGACQGEVPLPAGYKVVNRRSLYITTLGGAHLGEGSEDGQVKGSNVSGHISVQGKYRLVFKDITLGTALMYFEAVYTPEVPVVDEAADFKRAAEVRQALALKGVNSSPVALTEGLRQVENVDAGRVEKIKADVEKIEAEIEK